MRVPDDLTASIRSWAGPAGERWLAALPGLVAGLAADWGLVVGEPFQPSGYTSLTLRVERAGEPAVLKVLIPDEWSRDEGAGLRHYGGRAAVTLLAEDPERWALLLERCLPGTPLLAEPDDVATEVVAGLAAELWAPPSAGTAFRSLEWAAGQWADTLAADRRVDPALRAEAAALLPDLLASAPPPVVLHSDLHPANVLRASRRPWLAIDPKPLLGDPALDLTPVLRDRATPENVGRRFAILREVVDPARLRGWTLVKCVEGAAWSYVAGDVASGDAFAGAAALVAALRV